MAKALAILFETFPREELATARGLFGAIVIAGPAIGPDPRRLARHATSAGAGSSSSTSPSASSPSSCRSRFPPRVIRRRKSRSARSTGRLISAPGRRASASFQTVLEEGRDERDWLESRFILAPSIVAGASRASRSSSRGSSARRRPSWTCACCVTAPSGPAASCRWSSEWRSTARSSRMPLSSPGRPAVHVAAGRHAAAAGGDRLGDGACPSPRSWSRELGPARPPSPTGRSSPWSAASG